MYFCLSVLVYLSSTWKYLKASSSSSDEHQCGEEDTEKENQDGDFTKFQLESLQAHNDLRSSRRNNMKTSRICKIVQFPNWNVKAFLYTLNFTILQIQSEKLIFQLHQGKTWRSYDWAEYKGKHYALVALVDWWKIVMLWIF